LSGLNGKVILKNKVQLSNLKRKRENEENNETPKKVKLENNETKKENKEKPKKEEKKEIKKEEKPNKEKKETKKDNKEKKETKKEDSKKPKKEEKKDSKKKELSNEEKLKNEKYEAKKDREKGVSKENMVYVHNISLYTKKSDLREFLSKCGEISKIDFPVQSDRKSKGYAFVTFAEKLGAQKAILKNGKTLKSKELEIEEFKDPKKEE
jgi:RNA recognition motif-containing protein